MSKTRKIQRMLEQGKTAGEIAKKLGVNNAFVHTVKWQMKRDAKTPLKKAADKPKLRKLFEVKPKKLFVQPQHLDDALELVDEKIDLVNTRLFTKAEMSALDKDWLNRDSVNHPPHYTAGGIETIDFIEAKDLNYRLGNVIKYVSRAEKKENPLEDLKKAKWYLEREIATRERA